jgi:hypothetical protein
MVCSEVLFGLVTQHLRLSTKLPIYDLPSASPTLANNKKGQKDKTYNSRCSLMVTHSTTNLPLIGLTLGERTGSRIFQWIWSYVLDTAAKRIHTTTITNFRKGAKRINIQQPVFADGHPLNY